MATPKDPTELIRQKAAQYAGVAQAMACTQSAFKVGKSAFLYIGEQGGRYKAMFKLSDSKGEAEKLSQREPENYQVGHTAWVTARFSSQQPMPKKLWQKWLDESYQLCLQSSTSKKTVKKTSTAGRKPPRKSK